MATFGRVDRLAHAASLRRLFLYGRVSGFACVPLGCRFGWCPAGRCVDVGGLPTVAVVALGIVVVVVAVIVIAALFIDSSIGKDIHPILNLVDEVLEGEASSC